MIHSAPPRSNGTSRWTVFCDFDGTISVDDVTDRLMATFGMSGWQALEQRWENGEIGSQRCMSGQIALLDASRLQLESCLDDIAIDPHFLTFVQRAHAHRIPLYIVSDGLDYAIDYLLRKHHIPDIPILANHLQQVSERRWSLTFPCYDQQCSQASGTCKCALARRLAPHKLLMIGDGRSDFCVAAQADHVLAKSSLIDRCEKAAIPFTSFSDFSQAWTCLEQLITPLTEAPC